MEYSQTSALSAALVSYNSALADSPAVTSLAQLLATDSAALSSYTAAAVSLFSVVVNQQPLASNYLNAFPTQAQSLYSSVISAENSIYTANGFAAITPTGSASANGAMPTGHAMMGASAAAMAGFIGAVALL